MTKEDIELIDALVLAGAISRPAARELVAQGFPDGRVATRIMELGLCNACGGGYVIVDRLAKYEAQWDGLGDVLEAINKHDFSSRGVPVPVLMVDSEAPETD